MRCGHNCHFHLPIFAAAHSACAHLHIEKGGIVKHGSNHNIATGSDMMQDADSVETLTTHYTSTKQHVLLNASSEGFHCNSGRPILIPPLSVS